MQPPKKFYVYIVANHQPSHILYVGFTGDLNRHIWEHRNQLASGIASRCDNAHLVYYETFPCLDAAIAREKEIKAWSRSKKVKLVESANPHWRDLAADWQNTYTPKTNCAEVNPPPFGTEQAPRREGKCSNSQDDASEKTA
jgi:putative endonuclease